MVGIACVQMVSNSDPLTSPIHTRFDLPPRTSFEPLTFFALLARNGFQSFEYPTTLTTTCAPSFILSLIIILDGPTESHGAPHGSSTLLKRSDAQFGIAGLPALWNVLGWNCNFALICRVSPTKFVRVAWVSKYWYILRRWHLAHFLFLFLLLLLHLDVVTLFTSGGQPVCKQSGRNSHWCLWDIRIGVFEVIGELVVIRHRLHSYLPDLTLILSLPRSSPRAPEVGFEAFWLGFSGSWVQSSCEWLGSLLS